MAGIVFLGTRALEAIEGFYVGTVGMEPWLRQEDCIILKHGNLLLGFCVRPESERGGTITFVYRTTGEVDAMHERLKGSAAAMPAVSEKYRIYRFYARDPEQRCLEFQCFLHPVEL